MNISLERSFIEFIPEEIIDRALNVGQEHSVHVFIAKLSSCICSPVTQEHRKLLLLGLSGYQSPLVKVGFSIRDYPLVLILIKHRYLRHESEILRHGAILLGHVQESQELQAYIVRRIHVRVNADIPT